MKTDPDQPKVEESGITSLGSLSDRDMSPVSHLPSFLKPVSRQFWSAGDDGPEQYPQPISQSGKNRLRVHPKFLHSNATSHKWAFGAIAELLDNAVDEVQNGATFVLLDKIANPRDGNPALLIQDDGGGMDPESLRRCMSFGFSDKNCSSIGQYGNGFKTSTMRLGADVIVFSRCITTSGTLTQSVGLLSYTFLRKNGYDDIVVPMADYELNASTRTFERLFRHGQKVFSVNLATLLTWSPFSTEEELLTNFNDIGYHGTKVIVFNLWYNDEGNMELDFDTDPEDIMITGAHKPIQTNSSAKLLNENHIARKLRYSLRAYSSVLYLHLLGDFKIILRGREVKHQSLLEELEYRECVMYRPKIGGRTEAEVATVIGFLNGAPEVNIHGFNIYHKNRLILPFHRVVNAASSRGRGVSGVLEANFIKPTHDKQGFEKSVLFQKLETRLKEMTNEYWDCNGYVIGYRGGKPPSTTTPSAACLPHSETPALTVEPLCSISGGLSYNVNEQAVVLGKRRQESHVAEVVDGRIEAGFRKHPKNELVHGVRQGVEQRPPPKIKVMIEINKKLHAECLQYEQAEKELERKVEQLRRELEQVQIHNKTMMDELLSCSVKVEKC